MSGGSSRGLRGNADNVACRRDFEEIFVSAVISPPITNKLMKTGLGQITNNWFCQGDTAFESGSCNLFVYIRATIEGVHDRAHKWQLRNKVLVQSNKYLPAVKSKRTVSTVQRRWKGKRHSPSTQITTMATSLEPMFSMSIPIFACRKYTDQAIFGWCGDSAMLSAAPKRSFFPFAFLLN